MIERMGRLLEIISGARGYESRLPPLFVDIAVGVWWALLFLCAYSFLGAETKFLYIDF